CYTFTPILPSELCQIFIALDVQSGHAVPQFLLLFIRLPAPLLSLALRNHTA
ncbi:hypothetical protein KUCAC02_000451, partial [Chaenocephalus aceratus]